SEFAPQLRRRRNPEQVDAVRAVRLICRGLFKKAVIANFLATAIVDPVFVAPSRHDNWELLVGAWSYAVQIYADFSGYTDIAIGIALLMGLRFPDNFDQPYRSTSIQEFWRRWHMTLSRWLRDYLYIPLGGNRGGVRVAHRNPFLTMLRGGLWHGADWTFVFWGAFHGAGLGVERWLRSRRRAPGAGGVRRWLEARTPGSRAAPAGDRGGAAARSAEGGVAVVDGEAPAVSEPSPWLARLAVFHFVTLGWIFFRAPD